MSLQRKLALATATLAAVGANADPVTCGYGNLERTIEVVYEQAGDPVPCEVVYDKPMEGGRETPWRAQNEVGYCEARAAEFVQRLEGLGWSCDVAPVTDVEGSATDM